mmetsp:Transcript_14885/g.35957  ORF Transcript_14885/g.35957 Transcript_14885/m.35957 type:complete len:245 (+) Transcript_14885:3790-4524(+)
MVPFSLENVSLGNPWMFHCRIFTWSPRHFTSEYLGSHGMPCAPHSSTHVAVVCSRYDAVKAPRYAMQPLDSSTSPVSASYSKPSCLALAVHRTFSPPRPLMSFCARSSLTVHSSTSASSLALFSCLVFRSSFSALILSTTTLSSPCFSASLAITSPSCDSAPASAIFLGPTTLATRSYASMARTQLHSPNAAVDAFLIFSGSKSGLATYGRIFWMIAGGMLSLSYARSWSRKSDSLSSFLDVSQ